MKLKLTEVKKAKNYSRTFGVGDVTELAESLAENGQLMPILVTSDHVLVAGYRRLAAAEKLGWEEIWAEVTEVDPKVANLVENMSRKDLSLWEEIQGIRDAFGDDPSYTTVAKSLSKHRDWVRPRVDVWKLDKKFIQEIQLNKVDIGRLRAKLYNRKTPAPDSRYSDLPTPTQIREVISRLVEAGRTDEAKALSFAIGTVKREQLLD